MQTPVITQLHQKIVAGERRRAFLSKKIKDGAGTATGLDYDRAEAAFIDASIRALKFVDAFRWPELSPVVCLETLLEALDEAGLPEATNDHDAVAIAVTKARRSLQALDDDRGNVRHA